MTRNKWIMLTVGLAALAIIVAAFVVVQVNQNASQAAREDYATAWESYQNTQTEVESEVAIGEAMLPDCPTDTKNHPVCDRLSDAVETAGTVPSVDRLDVSKASTEEIESATTELTDATVQGQAALSDVQAENANASSEVALEGTNWVNFELKDPVRWAQQDVDAAVEALDAVSAELADGGLATSLEQKAEALQKLIDEINDRWEDITITEGIDYQTALSGMREDIKNSIASLEDAAGLNESGDIDLHD
ncbi:hypothetical protein [Ancrocorticia populi]|uniref:Uncharacterized protein n=1 Tax=Ancrocorticia populi TaxID=2175228 RepID=A0A2V1KDP8_9ACTO|nr:hypothetical protein [Ancrocorticia populi]PWF27074.1 hypothetical protein DD236_01305 [Ancrocorticia populi]